MDPCRLVDPVLGAGVKAQAPRGRAQIQEIFCKDVQAILKGCARKL